MAAFDDISNSSNRSLLQRLRSGALSAAAALTLSLTAAPVPAHADVYGYIDADGVAHVSTEKIDERYQLFMRGDATFDSDKIARGVPGVEAKANLSSPLMKLMLQHPNLKKYEAMLDQSAKEFSVEPALLKAIMAAESGFNPTAVSPKGAIGLMQIMPETAERYGVQGDRRKTIQQKLTDPKINIRLAARYLRDLQVLFPKRLELAIASYNAGERAVQKYNNQIPPYPETRNYVQLVAQFYQLYQPGAGNNAGNNAGNADASKPRRVEIILPGRRSMPPPTSIE
ncbi:lytic transglycosylase domain-containing protein [Herbaspirillum lusitanum]|uniref:lytic transglycosylase domain-containing protein n=1 Tax=Herbaspirillum lusitanum TaxID=213312 RepID=UPI0022389B06|nr:lytic transglycosylase domain-containing protein [Herbaspirillum lusitanum]MCW5300017.1 lytic transglycosylase domain-containing protein [Herbaspirillum lusitanum]